MYGINCLYLSNLGTGLCVQPRQISYCTSKSLWTLSALWYIELTWNAKRNIEALPLEFYDAQKADVWTMSPPCQPRMATKKKKTLSQLATSRLLTHEVSPPLDTRTGLKLDSKDPRSKSFLYLMNMLPKMKNPPKYILVENVKGFDVGGFIFRQSKPFKSEHVLPTHSQSATIGIGFSGRSHSATRRMWLYIPRVFVESIADGHTEF